MYPWADMQEEYRNKITNDHIFHILMNIFKGCIHGIQATNILSNLNSFFPRTIPLWNSVPSSVVSSKTIEEFKASI